jgi:hypothetical protein
VSDGLRAAGPLSYAELVASIDRVRFRTACATLLDEGLSQELCERVLALRRPASERLALLVALFQDLPLYSVLAACNLLLHDLPRSARAPFWQELAASCALERSARADAVETALFADFFADPMSVEEAWAALVDPGLPEACLRAALRVSAPVPWRLKRLVIARLLAKETWHPVLFQALRGGLHAFFGPTLEREEALLVLGRLALPGREAERQQLEEALGRLP